MNDWRSAPGRKGHDRVDWPAAGWQRVPAGSSSMDGGHCLRCLHQLDAPLPVGGASLSHVTVEAGVHLTRTLGDLLALNVMWYSFLAWLSL